MDNISLEKKQMINSMSTNNKKTTLYDLNKARYDSFLAKMEQSDMKNGYTRYLTEHSMLKQMKEYAIKYATEQDIQFVTSRMEEVEGILKEQFGIGFSEK